jgi:hypothetical protein
MAGIQGMNRGNRNRYKGGRLKPDLSLSGKHKEFFRQQAKLEIYGKEGTMREPTDNEIKAKCREMTYAWWDSLVD